MESSLSGVLNRYTKYIDAGAVAIKTSTFVKYGRSFTAEEVGKVIAAGTQIAGRQSGNLQESRYCW